MAWTDLFKHKTSPTQPDPVVRWFGKLPTYADYYGSQSDEAWAVEFNEWILNGYELYDGRSRSENRQGGKLPLSECVVRLPKSEMTVFASIQDYGGDMRGRSFPLCFYVGIPSALWAGLNAAQGGAAVQIMRDLRALRDDVARFFRAPGRFEDTFRNIEIDLSVLEEDADPQVWLRQGRHTTLADWFADAQQNFKVSDLASWCKLVAAWGEMIASNESDTFDPTLRFPLASSVRLDVQVAGWLHWLGSFMDLDRRSLSLVLPGAPNDATSHLVVIAREVVPEDLLLMTPEGRYIGYVDDLSDFGSESDEDEESHESTSPSLPEDGLGSWADFVEGKIRLAT